MVSVAFIETGPKIDEGRVLAFEDELGCQLPQDYRAFLAEVNGGFVGTDEEEMGFPYFDAVQEQKNFSVARLLGLDRDTGNDLRATRGAFHGRIPEDFLVIGRELGGDLVCMALAEKRHGAIFNWLHDYEGNFSFADRLPLNLCYVAPSFTDFLQLHRPF